MKTILSAALAVMLALSAMGAGAQDKAADKKFELAIEQQSLADALNEWAKQTGLQLVSSSSEMMNSTLAPRIKGEYTPKRALEELLKGTSLTYEWVGERAVAIREKSLVAPVALHVGGAEATSIVPPITRLARGEWSEQRFAESDVSAARTVQPSGTGTGSRGGEEIEEGEEVEEVEEIIVTGTHIRGTRNNTAAITVLDKTYIDSTGIGTAARLVESLPQNYALANQSGVLGPVAGVSSAKEQGAAINLRGVGEGTTLVLLNGRRMAPGFFGSAVDISAIPLSAIERVEIVTDGSSALYGSDAVGGVVNFVLRQDFDGAETRVRSGWAAGGLNEYRLSQVLGGAWDTGNALASIEYYKRDLLPATERDFIPPTSDIGSLLPRDKNYSAMFSGRQALVESVSVFADALYTKRDSFNQGGQFTFDESNVTDNAQLTATTGVDWKLNRDWQIETLASYARNKLDQAQHSLASDLGAYSVESQFEIKDAQLKADGPVFSMGGGDARVAVGLDWRSEAFRYFASYPDNLFASSGDSHQIVRSAFVEMYLPIVGTANSFAAVRRLDLSLAGRFDDYSNFGSSFNPKVGIFWEPFDGIRFRSSYGTSYRAPKLPDYNLSSNAAVAATDLDPGSETGVSRVLQVVGSDVTGFTAQKSRDFSLGLELVPGFASGLQFGLNYYRINYHDQIATPPAPEVILGAPASFGALLIRNPSIEEVNRYIAIGQLGVGFFAFNPDFTEDMNFDPSTIAVIVDRRQRNMSVVKTSGFDISIAYNASVNDADVRLGMNGTYIRELVHRISTTSDPFDSVDTFYNPPHWRLRGSIGWRRQSWIANAFVNYTDSYVDNRTIPFATISSQCTVDARLAYEFGERFKTGLRSGLTLSIAAQNVFDKDPPHTRVIDGSADLGFDPTNANPVGRLFSIELTKAW